MCKRSLLFISAQANALGSQRIPFQTNMLRKMHKISYHYQKWEKNKYWSLQKISNFFTFLWKTQTFTVDTEKMAFLWITELTLSPLNSENCFTSPLHGVDQLLSPENQKIEVGDRSDECKSTFFKCFRFQYVLFLRCAVSLNKKMKTFIWLLICVFCNIDSNLYAFI